MKIPVTIGFLALGIVLANPYTQAQSSTNQASSNIQTQSSQDTNTKSKKDRPKKAKRKRNRDNRSGDENTIMNSSGTTSTGQDSAYRGGSVSSGTTMNNSNVSNYNSQQVTTAPTGVGSTNGATSTVPASTGVSTSKGSESPNLNQRAGTGTGAAVAGAITTAPTVPNSVASPSTTVGDFTSAQVGSNGRIMLTDEMGKTAYIDTPDQMQANGVVHGITNVLMPRNTNFK